MDRRAGRRRHLRREADQVRHLIIVVIMMMIVMMVMLVVVGDRLIRWVTW